MYKYLTSLTYVGPLVERLNEKLRQKKLCIIFLKSGPEIKFTIYLLATYGL